MSTGGMINTALVLITFIVDTATPLPYIFVEGVKRLPYMVITRSTLPQNNVNLPLPFFCGNYSIVSWIIFIIDCICILTVSPG